MSWHFCTNTYCIHCVHCVGVQWLFAPTPTAYCVPTAYLLRPLCPLRGCTMTFCTKGNGPHHPYLLSTLCQLTFLHQHLLHPLCPLRGGTMTFCTNTYCILQYLLRTAYCVHCVGVQWPFALKVMAPTTLICWVHCVSWPFCTNTYCNSTVSTAWGYNDFLHQHLLHTASRLCPLHRGTITFCTNTYCVLRPLCPLHPLIHWVNFLNRSTQ